jgi:hypothetical protein
MPTEPQGKKLPSAAGRGLDRRERNFDGVPEPVTLATWRAWYPFTLNQSAKDCEQREHAEEGRRLAEGIGRLFSNSLLAYEVVKGGKLPPRKAAALRDALQPVKIMERVLQTQEAAERALREIQDAAQRGDAFALESLCEVAREAIEALEAVADAQPDLARGAAREREAWPVLASRSRKELAAIQERLRALQLGDGLSVRRDVKSSGSTARAYAEAVRDTLLQNQDLHTFLRDLYKTDPDLHNCPVNAPEWAKNCATLPAFNRTPENFAAWWAVAEAMLKDQCANLVDRPEWADTTRHSICRSDWGDLRAGTAHARILDKIKDALYNLALK